MSHFISFVWVRCLAWCCSITFLVSAESAADETGISRTGPQSPPPSSSAEAPTWKVQYNAAVELARRDKKLLVLYFAPTGASPLGEKFRTATLADPGVAQKLRLTVVVTIPQDAQGVVDGQTVVLLNHPAFAALGGHSGLAVIDYVQTDPQRRGLVVQSLPLAEGQPPTPADVIRVLDTALGSQSPSQIAEPRPPAPAASQPPSPRPEPPLAVRSDKPVSPPAPKAGPGDDPPWLTDYAHAWQTARREGKMLLVYSCRSGQCRLSEEFDRDVLRDAEVRRKLGDMVRVRLPPDATVTTDGKEVELLKHPAFVEMAGLPGLAVVDLAHKTAKYYEHVVSAFPFLDDRAYTADQMRVILDLPSGSLTQRTLIYAVRTHPEHPASTDGRFDPALSEEAESHCEYQARIRLQGHHLWETRFHRINTRLPAGCLASEVCAESWPGQGLLASAIECVRCWRLSSGHWGAVSQRHPVYGYDMKRGDNGIWYATGIFGRR